MGLPNTYHRCLSLVCSVLFVLRVAFAASDYSQCKLVDDKCSYHVTLLSGCAGETAKGKGDKSHLNRSEDRLEEVWRDLNSVKADYSRKIDEIEARLATLVQGQGNSVYVGSNGGHKGTEKSNGGKRGKNGSINNGHHNTEALRSSAPLDTASDQTKRHLAQNMKDEGDDKVEAVLLSQIQKEFSNLRRDLLKCKRHWRDADTLLTVTKERLNKTEQEVVDTNRRLSGTTRQLNDTTTTKNNLEVSLKLLNAELTERDEELEDTKRKLAIATETTLTMQRRIQALTAELGRCKDSGDELRLLLSQAEDMNDNLSQQIENMTSEIEQKNLRLMDCFKGKTSQFCGFEDPDICGFSQEDTPEHPAWVRWKEKSPSSSTGPTVDHTCANNRGYYMFVNASGGMAKGSKAQMVSLKYFGHGDQCVQFYYHMKGRNIGTLNVYALVPDLEVSPPTWRAFGNQGDVWIRAHLSIPQAIAENGYKIVFEGIMSNGFTGDIGIDDVRIFNKDCEADYNIPYK